MLEEKNNDEMVETAENEVVDTDVLDAAGDETTEEVVETVLEDKVSEAAQEAKEHAKIPVKSAPKAVVETKDDDIEIEEVDMEELIETSSGGAFDDFNWDNANKHGQAYSNEERQKYSSEYDRTLSALLENEVVRGRVNAISDGDVVLDVNFKSDGLVSLGDFRDMPDLKIGDYVEVYVEKQEDEKGQLVLSRRKAKLLRAWEALKDSFEHGSIVRGTVISKTKGGLIVDCNGLETFLPGSQIDIKPIMDYDQFVGKQMDFKVVKINEVIKNAVVSHKALIEHDLAEQRDAIIARLEKGQVLEGIVKNITDFGAFLDLGGVDGLLYITDISWGRINHPSEVLTLNQKVNVVVLDFDDNKKRISLGLKQLQPHPWEIVSQNIKEGDTVKGKVVNVEDYGAFLEVMPGVEGLIHISEVSWGNQQVNSKDFFKPGSELEAKVVTIDRDERKMSLSIKQLTKDPWSEIEERYPAGSRHTVRVKNITQYGVFVEMPDGIGGMIHISDLSWTKRYSHPSEFVKVGDSIEAVVLEVDKDNRKLSLGHKQVEENPWDTFGTVFPQGSYHEATVLRRDDRGAIVQMPHGLEAFSPIKHLKKEDGSMAEVGDTLIFKVIEFNRDDKRILVSHTRYVDDIRREADEAVRKERNKEADEIRDSVKKQQSTVERSTLGDLAELSQLQAAFKARGGEVAQPKAEAETEAEAETPEVEAPQAEAPEAPAAEATEAEAPQAEEKTEE